jgi:hypothetical protein
MVRMELLLKAEFTYIVDNSLHIHRVGLAHLELVAEAIGSTRITHGEVLVAPLVSQDLSQDMVVGNHGDTVIRVVRSHDGVNIGIDDLALERWEIGGPELSELGQC